MHPIHVTILPPPAILKNEIACIRIADYCGEEALDIKVAPNGAPGMVFQHHNGRAALAHIVTHSGRRFCPPPLFLAGPVIEPSVMTYNQAAFTTVHVIFKPCALKTLFGLNAAHLAPGWIGPQEYGARDLTSQLMEARSMQEQMTLLTAFLASRLKQENLRDLIVEDSLRLINAHIGFLHVKDLLNTYHLSERQFERRFTQAVGLTPQAYLRVKRCNAAIHLIKTRYFARLTDVAAALNFTDQSHLIHDIKAFSGLTPTRLARQTADFYDEQTGYSFI